MNKTNRKQHRRYTLLFILLLVSVLGLRAQTVAVKTNAVGWASASFNAGAEVRIANRWTGGINLSYNPWTFNDNRKWKHFYVSPEVRYWLCSTFAGHFFGVNLIYAHYNAGNVTFPLGMNRQLRDERHQGDLGAVGLFYGYSWMLSPRWSLEAEIGLGYGYANYKRYDCPKCGTYRGTADKHMLMPTKAAVSIIYNID